MAEKIRVSLGTHHWSGSPVVETSPGQVIKSLEGGWTVAWANKIPQGTSAPYA